MEDPRPHKIHDPMIDSARETLGRCGLFSPPEMREYQKQ